MRRAIIALVAGTILVGLGCNFRGPQPTPAVPTPTLSAAKAPTPTVTAAPQGGFVCVLAYEDTNADAMQSDGEHPLAGVKFALWHGDTQTNTHLSTTSGDPFCFTNLPAGDYRVVATPPQSYMGTNPTTLSVTVTAGRKVSIVLGFAKAASVVLPDGRVSLPGQKPALGVPISSQAGQVLYLVTEGGLYRSQDGGHAWSAVGSRPPSLNLVASPADPDWLLAGDGQDCFRGGSAAPLSISWDGGATWEAVPAGANLRPAAAHPSNPQIAWAIGCDGVYRTDDAGHGWQHQPAEAWGLFTLDVIRPAAGNPQVVYAAGNSEGGSGALFRSDDGGRSWATVADGLDLWITALLVQTQDADEIWFATPSGVWHSADGGAGWTSSAAGLEAVAVDQTLAFAGKGLYTLALADSGRLFLGTERGVYQSTDGSTTWEFLPGAPWGTRPIEELTVTQNDPGTQLWAKTPAGVFFFSLPAP